MMVRAATVQRLRADHGTPTGILSIVAADKPIWRHTRRPAPDAGDRIHAAFAAKQRQSSRGYRSIINHGTGTRGTILLRKIFRKLCHLADFSMNPTFGVIDIIIGLIAFNLRMIDHDRQAKAGFGSR
jgi:hypothetical protein